MQEEEISTRRKIEKLQRDFAVWLLSEDQYEDRFESVMQDFRLKLIQVMDWDKYESYKMYKWNIQAS